MLKSYLTATLRQLRRQKGYALLNIAGLAVGMACGFVLLLHVQQEWSYDRFHTKADRIFRVTSATAMPQGDVTWPAVSEPVVPLLAQAFPEIETTTRVSSNSHLVSSNAETQFFEHHFLYAEPSFFEVFDFEIVHGDPATALNRPYAILLTVSAAAKYFGDADPVGQTLRIDGLHDFDVVGLLADPPRASHLTFDFIASYATPHGRTPGDDWGEMTFTYAVLHPSAISAALTTKLPTFIETYVELGSVRSFDLQPLTDIWLHSSALTPIDASPQGNLRVVYLSAGIAIIILLLACINYMNLATARSIRRGREVSMRKVVGANRSQLMYQFFSEAVLFVLISLVLALFLLERLIPYVNTLMGWQLVLSYSTRITWMVLGGVTVFVVLLSGSYPALWLSSVRPIAAFRRTVTSRNNRRMRSGLVIFQFAATMILVVAALVIQQQLTYALTKAHGFAQDDLIAVPTANLGQQAEAFRQQLMQHPAIANATLAESLPFSWIRTTDYFSPPTQTGHTTDTLAFQEFRVGENATETLGLTMVQGDASANALSPSSILVNETAVQQMGWAHPIGQTLTGRFSERQYTVRGVVADFHSQSMHHAVQPMLFVQDTAFPRYVLLRTHPDALTEARAAIDATWNRFVPNQRASYFFYDRLIGFAYQHERHLQQLIRIFTAIALGIAVLGLIGLAAFTAEQRTREMGIRKVLGATVLGVVALLAKDVVYRIAIAFLLAAPLAYIVMDAWLAHFAYRVTLGLPTLMLAGGTVLLCALSAVLYQALRAALANPTQSLRHE